MNSRKAAQMMKRMGIQQVDIPAVEVIIRTAEKEIIITNPSVAKVNMMGQETYQISGDEHEQAISSDPDINEEDIATVMEQTNTTKEESLAAIQKHNGDLAQAIMDLSSDQE